MNGVAKAGSGNEDRISVEMKMMNQKTIMTCAFSESFIERLVDYLDEHYLKQGRDFSRLAIVFGGKRPALFMKRLLARRIKKSFISPRFFTIDEFVEYSLRKKENFQSVNDLNACYLIYTLAQRHTPEILQGRANFAEFLPWTREILSFIDQLDLENIDDKALRNIESNAAIGYPVPDDVNMLLSSIVTLRQAYHTAQQADQQYSRGMKYRRASRVICDSVSEDLFGEFDQIIFGNFFYFNQCEEVIVKHLHQQGKAMLMFQGDQRKWPVLDRIARRFCASILEGEEPTPINMNLSLHVGFDGHSQVGLVREIIKSLENPHNSVIVLPNQDTLIPLLGEIAPIIKDFNVSMGYPLVRSSLYTLCRFVFRAQMSRKDGRYYARDYLKVLRHPFVKNLRLETRASSEDSSGHSSSDALPAVTRILIHKVEEILTGKVADPISGSLFVELDDVLECDQLFATSQEMLTRLNISITQAQLKSLLRDVHRVFFGQWEGVANFESFGQALGVFLDTLVQKSFMSHYPLNLNIATRMYDIRDEFVHAAFNTEQFSHDEIFKIFDTHLAREMVAFVGSPLKGLQVLGLFETRSLDFENVIVMDVNEGVLPRLNVFEPLIPREVMISLNLDRLELEEEIQRYQFMRLISSAKNVHLVYQESKDKERSRFIEELIWEEQKKQRALVSIKSQRASFAVDVGIGPKRIKKTAEMMRHLRELTYSASSINTYLRSPLEFYENYVLGLREQEDLLDEPEARDVGTFIHGLLEEGFKPFLNKAPLIDRLFVERMGRLFDQRFDEAFGRAMRSDAFLLKAVIAERLQRFLENEQKNPSRQVARILYLENRFKDTINLSCGAMKFQYIVDRVDQMADGTIMIVDYKTGSVDVMPKVMDQVTTMPLSRETIAETIRSFQIPLYFHYLNKQYPDISINAALYNLRTLKFDRFINERMSDSREAIDAAFMRALDFVVTEILNPAIDFVDEG